MPLIESASKKAVGKNISREMHAGKPQKQAIAIALDVQRRARKRGKHFTDTGDLLWIADQYIRDHEAQVDGGERIASGETEYEEMD